DLSTTLLGAHAQPPEYADNRDGYVELVARQMVPEAAREGLAEAVDVYCDEGAFTAEESSRILTAARQHGLVPRIHAGQFADLGGAGLAAGLSAVSADHLEAVSAGDRALMAASGTVAVILPGAALTLRCPWPDVRALREAGVGIALGTDLNPGTSMTANLPLMMSLGCMQLGMTVEEAWWAVTRMSAVAALRPEAGVLRPGGAADLVIWDCAHYAALPYRLGANLTRTVIKHGRVAFGPLAAS
ncbi:MAG: amidohydrolase family protein, partial [Polyangia bacterium]|nr:amidohydrolase family protein [Polyangia bacterium]